MASFKPETEASLVDVVQAALADRTPLELIGNGTKAALGRPMQTAATLDLSNFSAVSLYEPEELVITAGAGTRLDEVRKLLDDKGQEFAFEPPDLSGLLGSAHAGTLGGMLACNLSGPRRLKAGAARDHILGVAGVSGRGEAFKAGGRVVKNVTGYDLAKLMAGSFGTLAALTMVTFKTLPRAEGEETLVIEGLSDEEAIAAMSLAMQSPCEVSAAAHLPQAVAKGVAMTLLRLGCECSPPHGTAPAHLHAQRVSRCRVSACDAGRWGQRLRAQGRGFAGPVDLSPRRPSFRRPQRQICLAPVGAAGGGRPGCCKPRSPARHALVL